MRTGAWLEAGTREAKPKVNGERLKGRTADVNRLLASKANSKLQNLETYVAPPPGPATRERSTAGRLHSSTSADISYRASKYARNAKNEL